MILNNSNTKTFLLLLTFFIFSCGGDSANNSNDSAQIDIVNEIQDEPLTNSNNESEKENMTWDNKEEMKGMNTACQIINQQISPMLMGRDLYLLKKLESALTNFKNKSE